MNISDFTNPDTIKPRVIVEDNFESNSDQNSNSELIKDYLENQDINQEDIPVTNKRPITEISMPKIIEEDREDDTSPQKKESNEKEMTTSEKKVNRYKYVFHHKSISSPSKETSPIRSRRQS